MTRLAYGVVAGRDRKVWAPGPDGAALDAGRAGLPAGAPVVVGPRRCDPAQLATALAALAELVARGGEIVAGADIDLGSEFRTGRLAGAVGDRRDAVLAALRVVGTDGAARLGDRAALLVALFGPAATRRVGAAAAAAVQDGRWAALQLACAASDLLGPEQLERVLTLPELPGSDANGAASALADDLARLLTPYPRPRRLALLLDLWAQVQAQREAADVRRRLRELRGTAQALAQVRERYQGLIDDEVLRAISSGAPVRAIEAALWIPEPSHWRHWLTLTMCDAMAATALARAAVAITEDGVEQGLDRVRTLLGARPARLSRHQRSLATGPVGGVVGVPARPGVYVGDLAEMLRQRRPAQITTAALERLRLARPYGVAVLEAVGELLRAAVRHGADLRFGWDRHAVREWRAAVGYTTRRPPREWDQAVLSGQNGDDDGATSLARRLRDRPEAEPADVEHPGDLLWYAELADAVAQLDGFEAALVDIGDLYPHVDTNPPAPPADPLRPGEDSVSAAAAAAAQLVDLGGRVPDKPRTWTELVDGLMAATTVAEALTGTFRISRVVLDHDGAPLPQPDGEPTSDVTIEVARDPHQLVAWASYMGNCISGPYYLGEALRGRSVLVALRSPHGHLVANVELRPHRTGWHVGEFRTRFNRWPPASLSERLHAWVAALPPAPERARRGPEPKPRRGHHEDHRPHRPDRDVADLRRSLVVLATRAIEGRPVEQAVDVLSLDGSGWTGIAALRRLARPELDEALRRALSGGLSLRDLWSATTVRPLAEALDGLDPAQRDRAPALDLLRGDAPLPALPRRMARTGAIAQARSVEVVARRLRRSLGRLARADDPVLAQLVPRSANPELLCALVLAVSAGGVRIAVNPLTRRGQVHVPGHPASTVDDETGPWRLAWADAAELGVDLPVPAQLELAVPTSWLGRGGWAALWARAHRARRLPE
jgi:hypothetical protein